MAESESLNDLRKNHPELAEVFGEAWQTPLKNFAERLYCKNPREIEPELLTAFEQEFSSMGCEPALMQTALKQLQETPVLQTSHHITPTHGPTFLAIDLICLSGLQPSQLYLIGANSGVAFSNSAWSGALSYGSLSTEQFFRPDSAAYRRALKADRDRSAHGDTDHRISLIPSRQRDQLLFGTNLTQYQTDLYNQFSDELQDLLPRMVTDQPFSQWSALAATWIQNQVFSDRQCLIIDINRVISRYLINILSNRPDHPCGVLLSNEKKGLEILSAFKTPPMFLGSYQSKKSDKVNPLFWRGQGLESLKTGYKEIRRQDLIQQLEDNVLCPGLFLLFFILRFLNGIRCLGSFSQINYLERFRQSWETMQVDWNLDLEPDFKNSLTTGRLYQDGCATWPLDLALKQQTLCVENFSDVEMGYFWKPIVKQLTNKTTKTQ